jgi:hypothetical protein
MNRFRDVIEDVRRRAETDSNIKKLLDQFKEATPIKQSEATEQPFRMPYSSDPEPIGGRWK